MKRVDEYDVRPASAESLFHDVCLVTSAPTPIVSRAVALRPKPERTELSRILGHLPMIKEARASRYRAKAAAIAVAEGWKVSESEERELTSTPTPRAGGSKSKGTGGAEKITPRGAAYVPSVVSIAPASSTAAKAEQGGALPDPLQRRKPSFRVQTPRPATPQNSVLQIAGTGLKPKQAWAERPPTPWDAAAPAETHDNFQMDKDWLREREAPLSVCPPASETLLPSSKAEEAPRAEVRSEVQEEVNHRVRATLAEVGIDPEGMSAGDILRILYARGGGSSYMLMTREAQKKVQARAHTPLSLDLVLKPSSLQELRQARDKPSEKLDECLDQWEIHTFADMCRSIFHFDEAAKGWTSEYTRMYSPGRGYLTQADRRKYVRPPTR